MGLSICKENYYDFTETLITFQFIIFLLYLGILSISGYIIFKISHSIKASQNKILILFYVCLNLTILIRSLYLIGGISPFCYSPKWYIFIGDCAPLLKEICLLCMLARIWTELGVLEFDTELQYNKRFVPITHYCIMGYTIITFVISVLNTLGYMQDGIYYYYGLEQITMVAIFGFAVVKLHFAFNSRNLSVPLNIKILTWYICFALITRIVYNLYLSHSTNNKEILNILQLVVFSLSELVICLIISALVFKDNPNSEENDYVGFLLKGTKITLKNPLL